jgi:hypothetical protein
MFLFTMVVILVLLTVCTPIAVLSRASARSRKK